MTRRSITELMVLPSTQGGALGACCSLDTAELEERVAAWRTLRDRAASVESLDNGVRLHLRPDERMDEVARLVALESECCGFYRFTIEVSGRERSVAVDAGPGGGEAVAALLGLG